MEITLNVEGMNCGGCEENIQTAVGKIAGVATVTADHEHDTLQVDVESPDTLHAVRAAIREAGFSVVS